MLSNRCVRVTLFFSVLSLLFSKEAYASQRHKHHFVPKGIGANVKHSHWNHVLTNCIKEGKWRVLGYMCKKALDEHMPTAKLQELAHEHECLPMENAIKAAKRLKNISKGLRLSFGELFEIAFFIETSLATEVEHHGPYLSRLRTGLAKTIEFDPTTKHTFIHLGLGKGSKIGSGRKKVVTKSFLYHKNHPQVVAHCVTETPMPEEIAALKEVHNLPGMMKMLTHTERTNEHGRKVYSIIC